MSFSFLSLLIKIQICFRSCRQILLKQIFGHDNLSEMGKLLDAQLYKVAPSFESYANKNTLQLRIRLLAMKIGTSIEKCKRKERERKKQSVDFDDAGEEATTSYDTPTTPSIDNFDEYEKSCQACQNYFSEKTRAMGEKHASMRCHELSRTNNLCDIGAVRGSKPTVEISSSDYFSYHNHFLRLYLY